MAQTETMNGTLPYGKGRHHVTYSTASPGQLQGPSVRVIVSGRLVIATNFLQTISWNKLYSNSFTIIFIGMLSVLSTKGLTSRV